MKKKAPDAEQQNLVGNSILQNGQPGHLKARATKTGPLSSTTERNFSRSMKGAIKTDPDNNHRLVTFLILETLLGASGQIISAVMTLACFLIQSDEFQTYRERQTVSPVNKLTASRLTPAHKGRL